MLHQRCNGHVEPHFIAESLQIRRGADAAFSKAEIGSHDDVAQPEALRNDALREFTRCQTGECRIEIKFKELFHTHLFQTAGTGVGAHQAKGGCIRCEIGAGVWLECQNAQWRVGSRLSRQCNDRLVAEMHAIEITNRGAGAAIFGRDILIVAQDLHGSCLALRAGTRKRAKGASRTYARARGRSLRQREPSCHRLSSGSPCARDASQDQCRLP